MRPRQYAAHIMTLMTREERLEALAKVPEECRELTKKHVEIAYERRILQQASKGLKGSRSG